jgi:hypothetical protein
VLEWVENALNVPMVETRLAQPQSRCLHCGFMVPAHMLMICLLSDRNKSWRSSQWKLIWKRHVATGKPFWVFRERGLPSLMGRD